MARFVITPPARENLKAIRVYLNRQSDSAWKVISGRLRAAFRMLAENPEVGFLRPAWTGRHIRFHVVKPYLIAYDPAHKPLRILNIIHSAVDVRRAMRP